MTTSNRFHAAEVWASAFVEVEPQAEHWRIPKDHGAQGGHADFALGCAYILAGADFDRMLCHLRKGRVAIYAGRCRQTGEQHTAVFAPDAWNGDGAWLHTRGRDWSCHVPLDDPAPVAIWEIRRRLASQKEGRRRARRYSLSMMFLALLIVFAFGARAFGHETASGWTYETECCGGIDCGAARIGHVLPSQDGWRIKLSPGDHHFFPGALDTVVPYGDPRLRRSQDTEFHLCLNKMGRVLCLYVPPLGG